MLYAYIFLIVKRNNNNIAMKLEKKSHRQREIKTKETKISSS